MSITDQYDELNRKVGEILRIALHIESSLDYFIGTYFTKPRDNKSYFAYISEQRDFFRDSILQKLRFETKKQIFRDICQREGCNLDKLKETIDCIDFLQNARNKVAHWDLRRTEKDGAFLVEKKWSTEDNDEFRLTEEFMGKINNARLKAINGIVDLQIECLPKSK